MNKPTSLLLVLLLTVGSQAFAEKQAHSIMFGDSEQPSDLTAKPETTTTQTDRCADLAREIEALKGKPQRRFTASQRYQAECER
jgi:hypothetical protein